MDIVASSMASDIGDSQESTPRLRPLHLAYAMHTSGSAESRRTSAFRIAASFA